MRGVRIGVYLALGKQGLVSMPRLIPARVGLSRASLRVGARGSGDVRICEYACLRGLLAEVRDPCQQVLLASAWRGVLVHPPGVRMLAGPASWPLLAWE